MKSQKIKILKFVDHWIGGPICWLLAIIVRVIDPFYKIHEQIPVNELPPKKVLIIKFFGLGSINLTSSIICSIKKEYKDTKVYFLTFKENLPILQLLSSIDKTLIVDTKNPAVLLKTIFEVIYCCHKEKIDIVMDIEFYSKFSTLMSFCSGARWRLGFYLPLFWRNFLVNVPIYFNYARHILEIYAMFSKAIGIKEPQLYPQQIDIRDEDKRNLKTILDHHGVVNLQHTIGINIHASDLALCRRWPLQKFTKLLEQIVFAYPHVQIILTGSKSEIAYAKDFQSLLSEQIRPKIIDLTGKISLKHFFVLLSSFPLFVTNDTGPFHLAKAVGARTVSLWGPGSIDLYGPFGEEKNRHEVVYKRYPCSPCLYVYRTDAGHFCNGKAPCMETINPEDVMFYIHKYLR